MIQTSPMICPEGWPFTCGQLNEQVIGLSKNVEFHTMIDRFSSKYDWLSIYSAYVSTYIFWKQSSCWSTGRIDKVNSFDLEFTCYTEAISLAVGFDIWPMCVTYTLLSLTFIPFLGSFALLRDLRLVLSLSGLMEGLACIELSVLM